MKKSPLPNVLGYSLYLSTFAAQWPTLGGLTDSGTPVFLSLHISEEFDDTYCRRAEEAFRCNDEMWLLTDVSGNGRMGLTSLHSGTWGIELPMDTVLTAHPKLVGNIFAEKISSSGFVNLSISSTIDEV